MVLAKGALGAALAAMGYVVHCDAATSAPVRTTEVDQNAFPDASSARSVPKSPAAAASVAQVNIDMKRALAVMERYHAMSVEAMRANEGPESSRSSSTDLSGTPTPLAEPQPNKASTLEDPAQGAGLLLVPKDSVPSTPEQRSSPNAQASASGGAAPAPQAAKPVSRRKKVPRLPASKLFKDLEAGKADLCVPHVIVGGGTAAWSAIQAIQKRDPAARILLVTDEPYAPYNRTPLSTDLWASASGGLFTSEVGTLNAVQYSYASTATASEEQTPQVLIARATPAVGLDLDAKTVTLRGGRRVQYDKLLLATGGVPRPPESVCGALGEAAVRENVSVLRTVAEFRELRTKLGRPDSAVAVVGGGFLGTELAVALATEGRKVSLLCAEPGVLYKVLPRYLSEFLSEKLGELGVEVVGTAIVTDATPIGEQVQRTLLTVHDGLDGRKLDPVDKIVVATGILPRTDLAEDAGLELDRQNGGIVVNDQMMAEADVWAAGDVASFWDRALGRRRVEHWDHAVVSGRIAGDRMAGGSSRYGLQSMFWSDLDNIGVSFSAVGRVEQELETVAVWNLTSEAFAHAPSANSYKEGVVWFVLEGRVVGAVLWNLHDRNALSEARRAIASKARIGCDEDARELIKLPDSPFSTIVRTQALVDEM